MAVIGKKKRSKDSADAKANFVLKGALTRLALIFNSHGKDIFTGEEVAAFLIESWNAYEELDQAQKEGGTVSELPADNIIGHGGL